MSSDYRYLTRVFETICIILVLITLTSCRDEQKTNSASKPVQSKSRSPEKSKGFVQVVSTAESVKLFEGLPHPVTEHNLFQQEKKKPTVAVGGFPFYPQQLKLKSKDLESLRAILVDPSTLKKWQYEKKCGGFHPDYALQWKHGSNIYTVLVCFGCNEAMVLGTGKTSRYDLGIGAAELRSVLGSYRKFRPLYIDCR